MLARAACYALAGVIALIAAPLARAEVFLLKAGGRVEADLLNPHREPGDVYQVRTSLGLRLELAADQVERVVVQSDVEKQYELLLPKVPNSVEGHWDMAEWCKEAGLLEPRRRHLREIVKLDPDHEAARTALGYSLFGGRWMTQEEFMQNQGYIRSNGGWRLKQEIELAARARQRELETKEWRQKIKLWLSQLDSRRLGEDARRNLNAVRDPAAAPALVEMLGNKSTPRETRLFALETLSKLPPGLATNVLIKLAMDESDGNLRDKALDELRREQSPVATAKFIAELQSKDNRRVNRAAICLQRLGDPDATLPLINAIVTKHEYIVTTGGSGGGSGMPLNFNSGGGPGQGGLGGLSVGGKSTKIKKDLNNDQVLSALTSLHEGVNFHFDEEAWRKWYIDTHTSVDVDLRRDE